MKNAVAALAVAAVAGTASAGMSISQTETFGPQAPNFSSTLTFDQYNGSVADLVSIEVIIDMSVSGGSATLDNDGETATSVDVEFGTSVGIASSDVSLLDGAFDPVTAGVSVLTNPTVNLGANDGDDINAFNDDGGADNGSVLGLAGSDNDSGFINTMFFSQYTGAGTFDIIIDAQTEFGIFGGSAVQGSFVNQVAEGSVTVIYNFIPTPGTAALLGLGGLAAIRRRG
ncbi:MAG: choice-of-anchor E domain-containing protein [Planctomycetota bacterium]